MNLIKEEIKIFLSCPLGLEELLTNEIKRLGLIHKSIKKEKGGVELEVFLKDFSPILPYFKIPTKALLRVESFKCRDLPKLYNKIKKINWNPLLLGIRPKIDVTCKSSRLIHTKKIEETSLKAIDDYLLKNPGKKKFEVFKTRGITPLLHFRFIDDICHISLDLSGERLDKRGLKTYTSEAPIRENLASACFQYAQSKVREDLNYFDPMCGSGTLLLEAQTLNTPQLREYYLDYIFPLQRKKITHKNSATKAIGIEISENTFKGLKKNILSYNQAYNTELNITVINNDCFKTNLSELERSFIISNSPYGERIKIKGDITNYFNELLEKFIFNFSPSYIGLILPLKSKTPKNKLAKQIGELRFSNGGLDVKFIVWEIQRP